MENLFENQQIPGFDPRAGVDLAPSESDMVKVRCVLTQFCREWSAEGGPERDAAFRPLISELETLFPETIDRGQVKVLVPGAGLGRLPFELAARGFSCQGNEYSYFMLCASSFLLNHCRQANAYTIYPFALQFTNNYRNENQTRPVTVPDVNPAEATVNPDFSMVAGNFVEVYSAQPDSWDAVVTCFFIDTAQNIIDYIETVHKCLKPGGYWLNFGPLMYHWADTPEENSIEPSYDDIKNISREIGFDLIKEETEIPSPYCMNPGSMIKYEYSNVFMVCRKRSEERTRASQE